MSFLTIQDQKQCLNCCQNANHLIKYFYYHEYLLFHKTIFIVKVNPKSTNNNHDDCKIDNDNHCNVYDFDLRLTRVNTSQIDQMKVNFGNFSLKQHSSCFIMQC